MYESTQAAVRRRNVSYHSTASRRTAAGRGRRTARSQEQVRLIQLAVCLVLFFTIFLWKGAFPQRLEQIRAYILELITTDLDFEAALSSLGESLADGDGVLSDLGAFCMEVFGAEPQETGTEAGQTVLVPPKPAGTLTSELRYLSQGAGQTALTAHYTDLSRFGLTVPEVRSASPAPEEVAAGDQEGPAEGEEAPAAVPAAGTVLSVSDYSGQALPNNYTMDHLSLGDLETMTPVMGRLNSGYGYRDHPIDGRHHFHGGVDISGHTGDPIAAFAAGTVEYTGKDDSYGLYLQIDHGNGVKSFYAHCSKVVVTKGQKVDIGEKVAEIGSSGSATGPHLHLELKFNKLHLDPVYYVDFLEE